MAEKFAIGESTYHQQQSHPMTSASPEPTVPKKTRLTTTPDAMPVPNHRSAGQPWSSQRPPAETNEQSIAKRAPKLRRSGPLPPQCSPGIHRAYERTDVSGGPSTLVRCAEETSWFVLWEKLACLIKIAPGEANRSHLLTGTTLVGLYFETTRYT
jgi:hypothetical protein